MSYTPTTWVDGKTPVNAANLNKLEQAVADIDKNVGAIESALDDLHAYAQALISGGGA